MEKLEYLLHLYGKSHISAVALDSGLRDLNAPAKELKYLLEIFKQDQIGGTALECALRKELFSFYSCTKKRLSGDEALDSGLRALRFPIEIGRRETFKMLGQRCHH